MTDQPDVPIAYIGGGRYRVVDENAGATFAVDVQDGTCTCENSQDDGTCSHLRVAIKANPSKPDYERRLFEEWAGVLASTQQAANEARNAAAYMSGGAAETADTDAQPASADVDAERVKGAFENTLNDAGLDATDFEYWINDQYGSLQVEAGYLEDGDFETWRELQEEIGMRYDGDNDRNYLPADGIEELVDDA